MANLSLPEAGLRKLRRIWLKVFIRDVLTHAEYDKGRWKK
jgi:mRNA-degrading endonuclease HigB of HigAB toxin-antitoxin module